MYIPPLPPKQTLGTSKVEFIEERCFLLNMFLRQTARCPYLVESEEFHIFARPSQVNLQRELSLLPRLSPENQLNRMQQYFSFIGNITGQAIEDQDAQIMDFYNQAVNMYAFLEAFKKHID
mmetsp:Transcript_21896/g.26963  ORF Transcript_21896/g.26963 Transcript_21896/m.26963 type:complete len:121 (-) Transcript_21896:893-1255(-)